MLSRHTTDRYQKAYERFCKRVPTWLPVDWSLINNMADLQFQIEHQLDLYEADDEPAIKTRAQAHRIKMLHAAIAECRADEQRRA